MRNLHTINDEGLVTGVVIMNNVIAANQAGGIRFSGDQAGGPAGPVPYGRIVNNTIVGITGGGGTGILVEQSASPTILNNIIADFATGINVDPSSIAAGTTIGSSLYSGNTINSTMGLGAFPASSPQWLGMLGMHGTLEANLAMHEADLVVCVGARFDDRVTGRLADFCPQARLVHVDIDPASIGKVVRADLAITGDCGDVLAALLAAMPADAGAVQRLAPWWRRIDEWRARRSLAFEDTPDAIAPQALP